MTLTAEQAQEIRSKHDAINAWLKENKRRSFRHDELPTGLVPPTNDETSALEVFEFLRDKPDRYFAYVKISDASDLRGTITTWTGEKLGDCYLGGTYRDNFGGKRRSISVQAINGCSYYGTYYSSAGDYCRLRKAKS